LLRWMKTAACHNKDLSSFAIAQDDKLLLHCLNLY